MGSLKAPKRRYGSGSSKVFLVCFRFYYNTLQLVRKIFKKTFAFPTRLLWASEEMTYARLFQFLRTIQVFFIIICTNRVPVKRGWILENGNEVVYGVVKVSMVDWEANGKSRTGLPVVLVVLNLISTNISWYMLNISLKKILFCNENHG